MDTQKYSDEMILAEETTAERFLPGDVFEPTHASGESDLNVHVHDMLAEPDVTKDPYATGGAR